MDFAAKWAEVIFTVQPDLGAAQKFYSGLKEKVEANGREGAKVAVLPGILPIIGDTEAQAKELADELADLIDFEAGRAMLNTFLQTKLDDLELDEPIPGERLPLPSEMQGQRSRYEMFYKLATEENYTLRGLIKVRAVAAGHLLAVGTAEQVADTMESWFRQGASDGFNLEVPYLTEGLTKITDQLVPVLRERGLFREDYTGTTLRDHLDLDRPAGRSR
jgi:alkanesulfonate monooxygenase SsuD/methylene tetrahydromethanopterin reductase-like flavin-dependent oxidoreductase (luciferase family)